MAAHDSPSSSRQENGFFGNVPDTIGFHQFELREFLQMFLLVKSRMIEPTGV